MLTLGLLGFEAQPNLQGVIPLSFVNAGIVGFRGSTQPTGGNPTDVLPQPLLKNGKDRWSKLENDLRNLVVTQNKEIYIIAGRDGESATNLPSTSPKLNVPTHVWKVVLILDRPGQGISNVTANNLAFAIDLDNTLDASGNGKDPDSDWTKAVISVRDLESVTGYDFFSSLSIDIQNAIERDNFDPTLKKILPIKTSLLAATNDELSPISDLWTLNNSSVGQSDSKNIVAPYKYGRC